MTERRVPSSVLAALGLLGACGPCGPLFPCLSPVEDTDRKDAPPPPPPEPIDPPVGPCLEFAEPPPEEPPPAEPPPDPPVGPCLDLPAPPPDPPVGPCLSEPARPPDLGPCLKVAMPDEPDPPPEKDGGASLGPRNADEALAAVLLRRVLPEDVAARLRARRAKA